LLLELFAPWSNKSQTIQHQQHAAAAAAAEADFCVAAVRHLEANAEQQLVLLLLLLLSCCSTSSVY
jgi:hypothetical protein